MAVHRWSRKAGRRITLEYCRPERVWTSRRPNRPGPPERERSQYCGAGSGGAYLPRNGALRRLPAAAWSSQAPTCRGMELSDAHLPRHGALRRLPATTRSSQTPTCHGMELSDAYLPRHGALRRIPVTAWSSQTSTCRGMELSGAYLPRHGALRRLPAVACNSQPSPATLHCRLSCVGVEILFSWFAVTIFEASGG